MNAIRKKLHSRSGASMLMALLLLLVAVMVSVVILSAASSAAKSVRSDREQQQTYLTVSSAAELMRDCITDAVPFTTVTTSYYMDEGMQRPAANIPAQVSTTEAAGAFSGVLNEALRQLKAAPINTFIQTYQITADGYDPVTADVVMKAENDESGAVIYRLQVTFTGGETPHECRMTLSMKGTPASSAPQGTWVQREQTWYYQAIVTETIQWSDAKIQRKEDRG